MDFESYASFWNHQAATPEGALAGVDGSADENTVQMTGRWGAKQIRAALNLDGSQHVLELGCGVGRLGRELLDDVAGWHGVDISGSMLKVARERLDSPKVSLSELSRTELDMFEDNQFDAAYSMAVLCHMDKEDAYLYMRELNRVVKPGGRVYLETWNLDHPMGWQRWAYEVEHWRTSDHSQRKNVSRNQFCVPQEFDLYLRHSGLVPVWMASDSPWIQTVSLSAGAGDADAVGEQLRSVQDDIAVSELFSELFGELLKVIYGLTPPGEMFDALNARTPAAEVDVFRQYLLALWKQGEAHWGPVPA